MRTWPAILGLLLGTNMVGPSAFGRPPTVANASFIPTPSPQTPLPSRSNSSVKPVLRVSGRHFVDRSGRIILLRGVNLSGGSKVPPFLPVRSISDLDPLPALGFNVIRLVFTWEAFEPIRGVYDQGYLRVIRDVVDAAWSRGLFVIIDIHQDGFSRFTAKGAGDGFPLWAVSPRAKTSKPDNGPNCRDWPLKMATDPAVYRSFADFYANVNGVRQSYLAMLEYLARAFADSPAVIGYDPLNEPWGDERKELAPLYEDAAIAIRAHDPSAILFLEGHFTTNCGLQTGLAPPRLNNIAYSPHFYDPVVIVRRRWKGCPLLICRAFENMTETAAQWNAPFFLGEFGIPPGFDRSTDYIAMIYDHLDQSLASGAQWNYTPTWTPQSQDGWNAEDFNILEPNGPLRANFQPRPYPRATAGLPLRFHFRRAEGPGQIQVVDYSWNHDPRLGETELFLPLQLFPSSSTAYRVDGDDVQVITDDSRQIVRCRSATARSIHLILESTSVNR